MSGGVVPGKASAADSSQGRRGTGSNNGISVLRGRPRPLRSDRSEELGSEALGECTEWPESPPGECAMLPALAAGGDGITGSVPGNNGRSFLGRPRRLRSVRSALGEGEGSVLGSGSGSALGEGEGDGGGSFRGRPGPLRSTLSTLGKGSAAALGEGSGDGGGSFRGRPGPLRSTRSALGEGSAEPEAGGGDCEDMFLRVERRRWELLDPKCACL